MNKQRKNLRYYFYDYPEWYVSIEHTEGVIKAGIYNLSIEGLRASLREQQDLSSLRVNSCYNVTFHKRDEFHSTVALKLIWVHQDEGELGLLICDEESKKIMQSVIYMSKADKIEHGDSDLLSKQELPRLPGRGHYSEEMRMKRLQFLRNATRAKLDHYNDTGFDPEKLTSNIENFIGSLQIPVGVAGPLVVKRNGHKELVYAPFATTEGALVASITRGATAISRSGGLSVKVLNQVMLRTPVFTFKNLEQAHMFDQWVQENFQKIKEQAQKVSNFSNLFKLETLIFGKTTWVKFMYKTGDASGQNMTTSCTNFACKWILEKIKEMPELELEFHIIEGNASSDKKVSNQSMMEGRGIRVHCEAFLPNEIVHDVLKVTPEALVEAYQLLNKAGQLIGMTSTNTNVANVIGAIFTATGQDIACVHESSLGHLELKQEKDGVYARMLLPALVIGTIGGGTNLPFQREMLEIMDCAGPGKVNRFAEIICGFALGLDLSTTAAIGAGHFARAHDKLGRNRPVNWFRFKEINCEFFAKNLGLANYAGNLQASYFRKEFKLGSSIITELTARKVNKCVGLFPFRLVYSAEKDVEKTKYVDVMLKVKPLGKEVVLMLNTMASMCDATLATQFNKFKDTMGFSNTHEKELELYDHFSVKEQAKYFPKLYKSYKDEKREIYLLAVELLQNMDMMNSAADVTQWSRQKIEIALDGIADIHSVHYKKVDEIKKQQWMGHIANAASRIEKIPLWNALAENARLEHNDFVLQEHLELFRNHIDDLTRWWTEIDQMPKTLIHNDFNPRNLALRNTQDGQRLCLYDLELMTVHIPQRDVVEFLSFVLNTNTKLEEFKELVDFSRVSLEKYTGQKIDPVQWRRGIKLAMYDYFVDRVLMYLMAHTYRHYKFMERVYNTSIHLVKLVQELKV